MRVSVERVEQAAADSVVCGVRCLAGTVSPGDVFDRLTQHDGKDQHIGLRVIRIWRYGRTVDLIDPPHTALIEVAGLGIESVIQAALLSGTQPRSE